MRVKVLGSAAGGGFPQWNCGCVNCVRVRHAGSASVARTQAQAAVTADGVCWFLLNASPDLRQQILATPEFAPAAGKRGSPIAGVVLTSADVDAVVGLLHLREFHPFRVYCTSAVRRILTETNSMFRVLERSKPPVQWFDIASGQKMQLDASGLSCTAVSLDGLYPDYVDKSLRQTLPPREAVIGLAIRSGARQAFFAPGLPGNGSNAWKAEVERSDLVLLDSTFWSDDELVALRGGGKGAREMGHPPLSGSHGLLEDLRQEMRSRKIAIHINNTNPILDENSPEHRQMREAGWEIAHDGMEFAV